MKKLFVIFISISILLSLFGCAANHIDSTVDTGQNYTESETTNPSGDSNESTTPNTGTTTTPNDESIPDNTTPDEDDASDGDDSTDVPVTGNTDDDKQVDDNVTNGNSQNNTDDNQDKTDDKQDDKPVNDNNSVCYHTNTKIIDAYGATCTKNGYTGNEVCTKCGMIVNYGDSIRATGHSKLTLTNQKTATCTQTGYTGDDVCTVCNKIVHRGSTIEKLPHNEVVVGYIEPTYNSEGYTGNTVCSVCNIVITYGKTLAKLERQDKSIIINHNGYEYVVTFPYDVNPWEYTSKRANKSDTHSNIELEKKIFNLLNDERVNAGLAPLEWDENGYYFTKLRSEESVEFFSHTRPNGEYCFSVYYEENVYAEHFGENLYRGVNLPEEFDWAQMAVDGWMNSPGHRANILDADFTKCAIAFVQVGDTFVITHHFYG